MAHHDPVTVPPADGPRPADADPRPRAPGAGSSIAGQSRLRAECLTAWDELWRSPIANIFEWSDLDALRRLWILKSDALTLQEKAMRAPEVEGSTGQLRANQLFTTADRLFDRVDKLEAQLALTVKARFDLRVEVRVTQEEAAALGEFAGLVEHVVQERPAEPRLFVLDGGRDETEPATTTDPAEPAEDEDSETA